MSNAGFAIPNKILQPAISTTQERRDESYDDTPTDPYGEYRYIFLVEKHILRHDDRT
jgi:hypothetical protein